MINTLPLEKASSLGFRPSPEVQIDPFNRAKPNFFGGKIWDLAKNYAGIIDSRESITRLALDLSAFDIPVIVSAATRNWKSFLEACLEAGWSSGSLICAPFVTQWIAKAAGYFFLNSEEKNHIDKLSLFYRSELTDQESFEKGLARIKKEEPKDLQRIAKLYKTVNKPVLERFYENKSQAVANFFEEMTYSDDKLRRFNKTKEAMILGQTVFEGALWGGFGLGLRWFRKNILKEERFTGTKKYLSDQDSKKLGEADDLKSWQKYLGASATVMCPIINSTLMHLTRDPFNVSQSYVLKMIKQGLDFTHGLYPRLGLLFSYTTIPKWFGAFVTTQGWDELIERMMKFCTLIPSWWLGHRVTNGVLAAMADKMLAKKYGVERGIMLEPEYVGKFAPDPAKIHHILERTEGNAALQEEARDLHAKVLYGGMALHSLGVLGVTMLVNQITKWRVEAKKKAVKV